MAFRPYSRHARQVIDRYLIPGEAVFPEGITEDPDGRGFYVSSARGGAIFRGRIDQPELTLWLPPGGDGRTSALGLAVAEGLLLVCGGEAGTFFAYSLTDGRLVARHRTPSPESLLNDVCVTGGFAYVTDSLRPVVWRFAVDGSGVGEPREWLDLTGCGAEPQRLHYLNGLVAVDDGRTLLVTAQGTGELWRVDVAGRDAVRIDLGGLIVNGDGMVRVGELLYICDNSDEPDGSVRYWLTALRLTADHRRAELAGRWEYAAADTPTTVAYLGGRLLLVHSQFGADRLGKASAPFTVGAISPPG